MNPCSEAAQQCEYALAFEPAMAHARKEPRRAVSSIPIKAKQIHEGIVLPTPHHLTQAEKCKIADRAS